MNANIDLKSINPKVLISRFLKQYGRHAAFGAVILVLLAYLFVVFRISSLAGAEPTPEQQSATANLVPKVDQKAIKQIQSLEDNNTQVHSLL